ncbi:MAG: GNAT family N-acetyltransferase [Bacteroidales bacterium]|nr:GNAT family N-acetyltransferase [Bacteroidales bacterium]
METIIPPVDRTMIEKELNEKHFVRKTNNGNNEIYIFCHKTAPNLMKEVGRLREITFRDAGGGTGMAIDIDEYDTNEACFKQLIVWNPAEKEIVGGYRFVSGKELVPGKDGKIAGPTAKLFEFSDKFVKNYWPHTIELGRSFVQPGYQPTVNIKKGMYSLDNLWDGLGAVVIDHPDVKYFFGKITMYPHFDSFARDMILFFLHKYFPDNEKLMYPKDPILIQTDRKILDSIFTGANYDENYRVLVQKVRSLHEGIPPLVNAYMNLSGTMKTFGTAPNPEFGDVEETAILIKIADIYDYKKDRHLSTYKK